jgi:peptidoglycan-N-acetylglucosamine deacetylase
MFNFRSVTLTFFILLFSLNIVSVFYSPVGLVFYILLITLYLFVSVLFSFFIRSGFHMKAMCNVKTDEKKVALTFDDGPHPLVTPRILDILHNRAGATFFVTGKNTGCNEALLKRAVAEGHIIGNHSWSHSNWFDFFTPGMMKREFMRTDKALFRILGKKPLLFRPPYGVINPMVRKALKSFNYHIIGFSNRSFDASLKDENKILKRITGKLQPGDIILLHDSVWRTTGVLEKLLNYLDDNGFKVVRLDELLNIQPYE